MGLAFGHADLGTGFPEWGYFDLVEMEKTIVQELFVIERELHFTSNTAKGAAPLEPLRTAIPDRHSFLDKDSCR